MNRFPQVIEDIIVDYKYDIEITEKIRNKYNKVITELEEIITDGDHFCNSFFLSVLGLRGYRNINNNNYVVFRDTEVKFSVFMFRAIQINEVD
jgi:hypothetical protein